MSSIAVAICLFAVAAPALSRAQAGQVPWTKRHGPGFTVSLPVTWLLVPATRTADLAYAHELAKERKKKLAEMYMSIYSDRYQWGKGQLLHAFRWPLPPTALTTDLVVKVFPTGGASVGELAKVLASELPKQGPGITVTGPYHMKGTTTDCYELLVVSKLDPSYGAAKSFNVMFLFERGQQLYNLTLRTELGLAPTFQPVGEQAARSWQFN